LPGSPSTAPSSSPVEYNDLGLFAEEYDPAAGRMVGKFQQASPTSW
jgi:hypothetical protein